MTAEALTADYPPRRAGSGFRGLLKNQKLSDI